jgi:RNA polymerase sigma factor (sigma-70 family)
MGDVHRASRLTARLPTTLHRESALWSRAARGDATAFGVLYRRHHQDVYSYCRLMLHDDGTARDAMRAAIARTFAAMPAEERSAGLRAWLLRAAREETMARGGRRRTAPNSGRSAANPFAAPPLEAGQAAEVVSDLARLPERQRTALVLRELNGLADDEIAEVLGCSPSDAMKTVFDARSALSPGADRRRPLCVEAQRALSDGDGRAPRGRRLRAHVRLCRGCADFKLAASRRAVELAALAPPLPAAAGAALLDQLLPAEPRTVLLAPADGADGADGRRATNRSTRDDRRVIGGRVMKAAAGVAAVGTIGVSTLAFALTEGDRADSARPPAVAEPHVDADADADADVSRVLSTPSRVLSTPAAAQRRGRPAPVRTSPARERRARRSRASSDATAVRAPGAPAPRRAARTRGAARRGERAHVLDPTQQPTTQGRKPRQPTPERRAPTSTTETPTSTSVPMPAPAPAPASPPQSAVPGPDTTDGQATEVPDATPPTDAEPSDTDGEPSDTPGDEPGEDGEQQGDGDQGGEPSD